MIKNFRKLKEKLPKISGVYLMKDKRGRILYVGKAGNLRQRVSSYFERPQDARILRLLSRVSKIDFEKTDTVIEALILEAELIKRHLPEYNIKDKDDKSFLHTIITREQFPRVLMLRSREAAAYKNPLGFFGPFTNSTALREAMKILRRIFPWSEHGPIIGVRPCFDYQIGLCPGICMGAITAIDYKKNIRQLIRFFKGEKKKLIREFKKEMKSGAKKFRFEEAEKFRNKIYTLEHIQDIALISRDEIGSKTIFHRIEGYDISNISGTSAVGSMVVFINGVPDKNEYRKFKIKTVGGANDTAMLAEVLGRRLGHSEWSYPDAILVDGGVGQVNAARKVLLEVKLDIPVIGVAKGPERKKNDFLYPLGMQNAVFHSRDILIRVRDEAHRFAIKYHRQLREKIDKN